MGALWGMGPIYAQMSGFEPIHIAAFMAIMVLGGLLVQWPVGALSDRFDRRTIIVATGFMAAAVSATAIAVDGTFGAVILTLACLFGGFAFPLYSLGVANVNDFVQDEDFVSVSSGLLLVFGVGAAIGPVVASVVMGQVGAGGFFLYQAVVFGMVSVFGIHRIRKRVSIPIEEQTATVLVPRTSPLSAGLDPRANPDSVIAEPEVSGETTG